MDLMQAIKGRRAVRKYTSEPVTEDELNTVLEAARWAPSWGNTQTWRLVVVRDPKVKSQIADTMYNSREPDKPNRAADGLRAASVGLVVCAQEGLSGIHRSGPKLGTPVTDKGPYWFMFDTGMAMQNLTLAAYELGLGTIHIGVFDREKVRQLVGVPANLQIVELMALGRPAEIPVAPPRKEISQFVVYEHFPIT